MKAKIGQVTLWNYNYGSVLQCYATQQILNELGYQCELLYRKESGLGRIFGILQERSSGYLKYLKYPQYIRRFRKLRASTMRNSSNMLSEPNIQAIHQFIGQHVISRGEPYSRLKKEARTNQYLAYLTGSDQVWSGSWFVPNPLYFLRFAPKEKRIAWSPSFGIEHVDDYNIHTFKRYIRDFTFLSAREQSGVKIIKELTNYDAVQIIDPSLVISSEKWLMLLNKQEINVNEKDYILAFFLDTPSESAITSLKKIQSMLKKKVVSFAYNHTQYREIEMFNHIDGSPWIFLHMIKNANIVLTDSFHAIAFCMQFQVEFYVFKRQYLHPADQSERLVSLLQLCNAEKRMIDNPNRINLKNPIDFSYINCVLEEKRIQAYQYLHYALEKVGEASNGKIER